MASLICINLKWSPHFNGSIRKLVYRIACILHNFHSKFVKKLLLYICSYICLPTNLAYHIFHAILLNPRDMICAFWSHTLHNRYGILLACIFLQYPSSSILSPRTSFDYFFWVTWNKWALCCFSWETRMAISSC